jgi:hypothetical protein
VTLEAFIGMQWNKVGVIRRQRSSFSIFLCLLSGLFSSLVQGYSLVYIRRIPAEAYRSRRWLTLTRSTSSSFSGLLYVLFWLVEVHESFDRQERLGFDEQDGQDWLVGLER